MQNVYIVLYLLSLVLFWTLSCQNPIALLNMFSRLLEDETQTILPYKIIGNINIVMLLKIYLELKYSREYKTNYTAFTASLTD